MEKSFECHSATHELLSHSYCNRLQKCQKTLGPENFDFNNFQIPEKILEKRKRAWNDLFTKYSTMVPEVELNFNKSHPEDSISPSVLMDQCLPMRKPTSMVQYWVNTGNLVHVEGLNGISHSDSGSSLVEDTLEPIQSMDTQSLAMDSMAEEHFNVDETLGTSNLKVVLSPNSSVNTAAYILANNNVTKRKETVTIVQESKCNAELQSSNEDSPPITPPVKTDENMDKTSSSEQKSFEKLSVGNNNFSQTFLNKNYIDKINKNFKNATSNKVCKNKMSTKSKHQKSNICSIFFSDSDESVTDKNYSSKILDVQNCKFPDGLNHSCQTSYNSCKLSKRKMLYNQSDSPAEFTPVSEDDLSLRTSSLIMKKCGSLKKTEHPALDTPKISSRLSYRTRFGKVNFKKTSSQREKRFSLFKKIDEKSKKQQIVDVNENDVILHQSVQPQTPNSICSKLKQTVLEQNCLTDNNILSHTKLNQTRLKDEIHLKTNSNDSDNSQTQFLGAQTNEEQELYSHKMNSSNNCNNLFDSRFKLKPLKIIVHRLPYQYSKSKLNQSLRIKKNSPIAVEFQNDQGSFENVCTNRVISTNISTYNKDRITYSKNDLTEHLFENIQNIGRNNIKKLNNEKVTGNKLNYDKKAKKLTDTTKSIFLLDDLKIIHEGSSISNIYHVEKLSLIQEFEMPNDQILYENKSRYVIADSSSDESDLITSLSNSRIKMTSKKKDKKKMLKRNSDQILNNFESKNNMAGLLANVENGKYSVSSANEDKLIENSLTRVEKMNNNVLKNNEINVTCNNEERNEMEPTMIISLPTEDETVLIAKTAIESHGFVTTSKKKTNFTETTLHKCENITHKIMSDPETRNEFNQQNVELIEKNEPFESITNHDRINKVCEVRNKSKVQTNDYSFSSNGSGEAFSKKSEIFKPAYVKNSPGIKSNQLPSTDQDQQYIKQMKKKDSSKVVDTTTEKLKPKKRKNLEINLSSDEECIIPLKQKT